MRRLLVVWFAGCLALGGSFVGLGQAGVAGCRLFSNEEDTIFEISVDELTGQITAYPVFHDHFDWFILGLTAGPDGLLYFSDTFRHRILRIDPDGAFWEVVVEQEALYPAELSFGADGTLYFSNMICSGVCVGGACPVDFAGIWAIEDATAESPGPARCLIDPLCFDIFPVEADSCRSPELRYVPSGPYAGGLLTDAINPHPSLCVVTNPTPLKVAPFLRDEDLSRFSRLRSEGGYPTYITAFEEAFLPNGDLLATDPYGDEVLRFAPDGSHVGRFASFNRPFRLAVDSAGNVYVTSDDDMLRVFDENGGLIVLLHVGRKLESIAVLETAP